MFPLLIGILILVSTVIISEHYDHDGELFFWESFDKDSSHNRRK